MFQLVNQRLQQIKMRFRFALVKRIIVHTEDLNSYKFWIVTKGIDMTGFKKNPIMLYNHHRSNYSNPTITPCGTWKDIEVDANGTISAVPVFDLNDEMGAKLAKKFEDGFINAASIGITVVAHSDDTKYYKQGQKYATVTKCVLKEISLCDIPANSNAVSLYDNKENAIKLSAGENTQALNTILPTINKQLNMKVLLSFVAELVGLKDETDEAKLTEALEAYLSEREEKIENLTTENKQLASASVQQDVDLIKRLELSEQKLLQMDKARKEEKAAALVNLPLSQGRISENEAKVYREMALTEEGYKQVETLLSERKVSSTKTLSGLIEAQKKTSDGNGLTDAQLFDKLHKEGKLVALKNEDIEKFNQLKQAKIESIGA